MKYVAYIILIFASVFDHALAESLNHFSQDSAKSVKAKPAWLRGLWKGTGYQLNNRTTWSILFNSNTHSVDYPSLACGGSWKLISSTANKAYFRETITYGKGFCLDQGKVVITKIDKKFITYSYFYPNDTTISSFSTLMKE